MKLRTYLTTLTVATIICVAAFVLVIFLIDPEISGVLGKVVFYLSLFFSLVGIFTLIGYWIRIAISRKEIIFAHVGVSFRQALLLTIAVVSVLFLQSLRILNWWDGSLLAGLVILIEFFFLSRRSVV